MVEININELDKYFLYFKEWINTESPNEEFKSFRHSLILNNETGYKLEVKKNALNALRSPPLKQDLIGTGKIIDRIIEAIDLDTNLIKAEWRSKDKEKTFNETASKLELIKYEQLLYDFIKKTDTKNDKYFFEKFVEYGKTLRFIAYLFFIKDDSQKKYMPILQLTFDKVFKILDIDLKTSGNWDWGVYLEYNQTLELVRLYLEKQLNEKTSLTDAHSFLYMMSYIDYSPNHFQQKKKTQKNDNIKFTENALDTSLIQIENTYLTSESVFDQLKNEEILSFSVDTLSDFNTIENAYLNAKPEVKQIITKKIERGNFANKVKRFVGYKCFLCEANNKETLSFKKPNGKIYVEVHHVEPVSTLKNGSLALSNLITLCANHHRQMHFGNVEYKISEKYFLFTIDNKIIKIEKIDLSKVKEQEYI